MVLNDTNIEKKEEVVSLLQSIVESSYRLCDKPTLVEENRQIKSIQKLSNIIFGYKLTGEEINKIVR